MGGKEAQDVGGKEAQDVGGKEAQDVGGKEAQDVGGKEAQDVGGKEAQDMLGITSGHLHFHSHVLICMKGHSENDRHTVLAITHLFTRY